MAKRITESVIEKAVAACGEEVSKAVKARTIHKVLVERYGVVERKEHVKRFVSLAGLTEKGAATYFQNIRKAVADGKIELDMSNVEVEEPVAEEPAEETEEASAVEETVEEETAEEEVAEAA